MHALRRFIIFPFDWTKPIGRLGKATDVPNRRNRREKGALQQVAKFPSRSNAN
jgi:hypothetical protein